VADVSINRMITGDKRAEDVFVKDVEDTYAHLVTRVAASKEEEEALGRQEQIQLVPENPTQSITFNVPSGPPPEELVLEGPGTEDMDINEVRKALEFRWTVFEGFSEELKEALKGGTLEGVNKVLGEMKVDEAEEVVKLLDMGGILSFAEGGIRDETGKGKERAAAGDSEEEDIDKE
jgi:cell division cycle protein 37